MAEVCLYWVRIETPFERPARKFVTPGPIESGLKTRLSRRTSAVLTYYQPIQPQAGGAKAVPVELVGELVQGGGRQPRCGPIAQPDLKHIAEQRRLVGKMVVE